MIKIIALAFTLLGIALLAQSLRPAYIIYKRELSWGWLCLIILISFFILGYGIMMIAVYYKVVASIFDLVVATILLGGSIFVTLVMQFSLSSINKITHMTRQQHASALLNERNNELIARLPSAITETEFELHYQPLVSVHNNTVQGVECLIRWPQSDGSAIAPLEFIKLAEQSHVIVDITHWVIETSLKQLGQWHSAGNTLALQINISARDLDEPELVTYITQHLQKNNIEAHFLTLEITENLVMGNPTECITILQKLRDLGVGVSLDDFGTGYSSMTLLNQLPLSQIKIDRSFVLGMEHNSKHMSIVQSTLDLGKNIGLEIIAEGVENAQQALLLKQMNCTLIQGYYIAKPMSVEELEHWLMRRYANSAPQRKHTPIRNQKMSNERAVMAGGCFWGMQDLIRNLPGIISTRVGYTGGDVPNATYQNHGYHAEGIEIIFDAQVTSFRTLLELFFQIHDPTTAMRQGNDMGPSYRSAIYFVSPEQEQEALRTINDVNASGLWPGKVVTEVEPVSEFWEAEPHHQDYLEKIPNGYTCHFLRKDWVLPKT